MKALWTIAMIVAVTLHSVAAEAQQRCGPREALLKQLGDQYKEKPFAVGINADGTALEIIISKTGTYTVLKTRTDGTTCLMISGDSFEYSDPAILQVTH